MNRSAQALVLTAVGGVALRVGITDEYTRYVNEWMRWPLVVSGVLVLGLALTALFPRYDDEHPTTPAAWALLIPVVIAFVVQPPALGSYLADRRVNDVAAVGYDEATVAPLDPDEVNDVPVAEFVALAASYGEVLVDRDVRLRGFVTRDGDDWFVTRLSIRCCAADASAFRIRVDDSESPPKEQWVDVVGQWVEGSGEGVDASEPPAITASEVTEIAAPKQTYE